MTITEQPASSPSQGGVSTVPAQAIVLCAGFGTRLAPITDHVPKPLVPVANRPVLDRVLNPDTPLNEAAKCALVSMDSTLKSNLSVGLPLDMVVYEADSFRSDKVVCIDEHNPYFQMLHNSWGQRLREVFDGIEDPMWNGGHTQTPLLQPALRVQALKKIGTPQDKLI